MIISKLTDPEIISNEMLFVIACTLVIGYWIYQSILKYLSPLYHIPEPSRYWLLNHLPYFLEAKDELDLYLSWAEQFKEYGMFKLETLSGKFPSLYTFSYCFWELAVINDCFEKSRAATGGVL